jgi:septum formation protein
MNRIILASGSSARAHMLRQAGLSFDVSPAPVDEPALLQDAQKQGLSAAQTALHLAGAKARAVSLQKPAALVIGGDQVLICEGEIFSKADNAIEARAKLMRLRGRAHSLFSAAVLAQAGDVIWSAVQEAQLQMHNFNEEFLEGYIARADQALTQCVGAYAIEDVGIQLFEDVRGDIFTIQGLPLLPLLAELRGAHGLTPAVHVYEEENEKRNEQDGV